MTQTTEIKVSSSTEPFALTNEDKQPAWVTFYNEFAAMQAKISIDELKQNYPACQNILSLLHHLHSDCANPEQATVKTLEWLAGAIRKPTIETHLAFCDGQGTGKSLLTQHILKPIFGNKTRQNILNSEHVPILQYIELHGDFYKKMETQILSLPDTKFYVGKACALIFETNGHIPPMPSNRIVRIARCKTLLPTDLFRAVIAEIDDKGLMTFADLLHQIQPDTDQLPNLNAIY